MDTVRDTGIEPVAAYGQLDAAEWGHINDFWLTLRSPATIRALSGWGVVKYPLNDLVASPTGAAETTTVIQNVDQAPPASGWYINVQASDRPARSNKMGKPTVYFQPIICGNIGK